MIGDLDRRLFEALNRGAANPALDWLMPRITNLHQTKWFLALAITGAIIAIWRGSRVVQVAVVCAGLAVGISDLACARIVKPLFVRPRPCRVLTPGGTMSFPRTRLVPGEHCPGSSSFPSNHASNMMALVGVGWWFTRRKTRWLWFLLPLVIGYSRIYLGYHYPLDTLGGWLLGALIAAGMAAIGERILARMEEKTPPAVEETGENHC